MNSAKAGLFMALLGGLATACGRPSFAEEPRRAAGLNGRGAAQTEPRTLSLQDVAERISVRDGRTFVFDANPPELYKEQHVPGARWIDYNSVKKNVLPADRRATLIFYCANRMCTASHQAAKTALSLGWTEVYVMPEGIFGWVRARLPIEGG